MLGVERFGKHMEIFTCFRCNSYNIMNSVMWKWREREIKSGVLGVKKKTGTSEVWWFGCGNGQREGCLVC